ncbi:hypothetical protein OEZ60_21160 [Defluviimonas sp. WL0024]|uniref:Uncharacterized protein n=1 Tax=Albidovulum salinarum TaxID=2984153 RepID=A0ABT2X977_9RHOB|nr:hypothetical protein [Defluviimonas sp. WL0024]MCU9850498.1 hypothetical protein [Defluviimonas sp. WL0024]
MHDTNAFDDNPISDTRRGKANRRCGVPLRRPDRIVPVQRPGRGDRLQRCREHLPDRHRLIQHSGFDRRAIHGAYAAFGRESPRWRWGDSVRIARRAWPEFLDNGGHGLAHLKQRPNLDFDHHDAGDDARAAALVVLHAERRTQLVFETLLGKQPL